MSEKLTAAEKAAYRELARAAAKLRSAQAARFKAEARAKRKGATNGR